MHLLINIKLHGAKIKITYFMFNNLFFRKSFRLWDNVEKYSTTSSPQMTVGYMHIACWITKASNTHSEYVILIAFPLQHWLQERTSMLCYTYIACLAAFYIETRINVLSVLIITSLYTSHRYHSTFNDNGPYGPKHVGD